MLLNALMMIKKHARETPLGADRRRIARAAEQAALGAPPTSDMAGLLR
jgi:NADH-quinone oxidoreductase subunit B